MTDLDALIAAVEAGGELLLGDFFVLDRLAGTLDECGCSAAGAFNGSLDAALALLGVLLPKAVWWRDEKGRMWVGYGFSEACASDDMASRALLLAILKAYRETMEESK